MSLSTKTTLKNPDFVNYYLKGTMLKSPVNTFAINTAQLGSAFTRFKVGATHSELA